MLYRIYTKYLDKEPTCYGTLDFGDEFRATTYAYFAARDVFSQHATEEKFQTYEDYHDALFSAVEFWVEEVK